MNRNTLRKIHAAAGAGAFLFIASFWSSTVLSELFGSHETVAAVKQTIVYALFGLIACMATAGATGMKMGGKSKHAAIAAKRRRMPFIAANGVLILLPCAFFLNSRAAADIAPKTWLQQLQTYAAQHGFAEEFERVWTTESWPMQRVAAFQVV